MITTVIPSILVFGEALVDEFPDEKVIGGAPFNVARNLAHFGCTPLMLSRIGQDVTGTLIRAASLRCGLSQNGLQEDAVHPSGRVLVMQDDAKDNSSHRFQILPDQAYDYIDATAVRHAVAQFSRTHPVGMIYFGSLAQRSLVSRQSLHDLLASIDAQNSRGGEPKILKYLDLNLRDGQFLDSTIADSLGCADIVKLNEDELLYVLAMQHGGRVSTLDLQADRVSWTPVIKSLMQQYALQAIIVTLGARGYAYYDVDDNHLSSNQDAKTVVGATAAPMLIVDTVGGGDAFSAVFLAGQLRGWPLANTLRRAHEFATAVCGIRGAVSADPDFYQRWLNAWATEQ